MRALGLSALLLTTVGCSETGINGQGPDSPELNDAIDVPERVMDEFVQADANEADVLFVISNWWSMDQAYAELVDNFDDLLNVLLGSGVDYHIGVISTDTDHSDDNGKLKEGLGERWISPETERPLLAFAQMATMDSSGCVGPRRPRDATYMALEHQANTHNLGFRRDEATIHTIFVNDEQDSSYRLSFEEWVDWYGDFGPRPEVDSLSTIVDVGADSENVEATLLLGGSTHDIRDLPWANVMKDIGLQARGPKSEFPLSRVPVLDTLQVWVTGPTGEVEFDMGTEFSYIQGRNTILFDDYQPPSGARIDITYEPL